MRFKQWLLNEGFELPYDSYKEIHEYYKDCYEKSLKKPRIKFEPKIFEFDINKTRYAFLSKDKNGNNNKFYIEINIFNNRDSDAGWYNTYNKLSSNAFMGKIWLNLYYFDTRNHSIISHEILHFIQDMIKINKNLGVIGGLPSPALVKGIMREKGIKNVSGQLKDPDKRKKDPRIDHALRPIEYYTNLDSLVLELQTGYVIRCMNDGYQVDFLENIVKNIEKKKEYFNKIKDQLWRLTNVKFNKDLYNIYLQGITKRFILNDKFLPDVIDSIMAKKKMIDLKSNIKGDKLEKKKKAAERKEARNNAAIVPGTTFRKSDFKGKLIISYYSLLDRFPPEPHGDSEAFGNYLESIGFKTKGSWNNENVTYYMGLSFNNISKVFKQVCNKSSTYYDDKNVFVIGLSDNIARILRRNTETSSITKEQIIDIFYKCK